MKNITGDVHDLNHSSCLVVVTNEVFDFKLYVLELLNFILSSHTSKRVARLLD